MLPNSRVFNIFPYYAKYLFFNTYRIVRAFLIEEQKIVVRVLKAQEAAKKASK
jgi:hypothetical protein